MRRENEQIKKRFEESTQAKSSQASQMQSTQAQLQESLRQSELERQHMGAQLSAYKHLMTQQES